MKQSAAKTLGATALGAAIAATGAGVGHAAAPALPDTSRTLGTAAQALPVEEVARTLPTDDVSKALPGAAKSVSKALPPAAETVSKALPDVTDEALSTGKTVLGQGVRAARPAVADMLREGPAGPVAHLLGGLPVKGLPMQGLGVNGLPLGG
ncbi:ATP-binding protein [Streptomyces sp. CRN 30]|uniref:ATP-binding protein n=1 Tax=Streptomyces sp. CRN 30 TaxID=3075613 RepID=UPI002A829056|nr:ATP-binding protein [Streptomyces sp. CRN 30]